jgi:hypothetical protein
MSNIDPPTSLKLGSKSKVDVELCRDTKRLKKSGRIWSGISPGIKTKRAVQNAFTKGVLLFLF